MALSISRFLNGASIALIAPAAIVLAAPACSSDEAAPTNVPDGGETGGSTGTGGAKNTGGGKNTGGANTGGSKSTGGQAGSTGGSAGAGGSTGGSPGTGGADAGTGGTPGTGGASTGGTPGTGGAPIEAGTDAEAGCAPLSLTPPTVTAPIQAPAGATVVQHFHAEGTQNYTCKGTVQPGDAGTTYSWGASVPEAKLFQGVCEKGTHYAGPTWEFTSDGSTVVAAKVEAETHAGTIPWLLLKAVSNTGTGVFSNVTFVQRVDTTGGVAPSDPCDAQHENDLKKITYTAEYYFFEGGVGDGGP